jgi:fumarate reductase flavoprotein subunit
MAAQTQTAGALPDVDRHSVEAARERALAPLGRRGGDLEAMRRALYDTMWDDVGILRTAQSLARGRAALDDLADELDASGVAGDDRRYNLTWMDRLNLENLVLVSRAICAAADARCDSRGAHFREDFPGMPDLSSSRYTLVRNVNGDLAVTTEAVEFTRVRPGETLLPAAAE